MNLKVVLASCVLALSQLVPAGPPALALEESPGVIIKALPAASPSLPDSPAGPKLEKAVTRGQFIDDLIRESGLNLDNIRFFKAPDVREVAPDVSPDSPYAGALIIAGHFGVVENKNDFHPANPVSREEAAFMAVRALLAKAGPRPVTGQYIIFSDAERISAQCRDAVQTACKIGLLGAGNNFRPEDPLTPDEHQKLLEALKKSLDNGQNQDEITWELSGDGKTITLSWGEKPTGGYSIKIISVKKSGENLAVLYSLKAPGPGDMVTQAITCPRDTAALPEGGGPISEVVLTKVGNTAGTTFYIDRSTYTEGGVNYSMDASPFLENGRAMMPARYLALALGVPEDRISWNPESLSVTLSGQDCTVVLAVGEENIYINGSPAKLDTPPVLCGGRVYLPAGPVAGAFGCTVEWSAGEQAVLIYH